MIYCIPLDSATEEFYASVARAAGLPWSRCCAMHSLSLRANCRSKRWPGGAGTQTAPGRLRIKYAAALN